MRPGELNIMTAGHGIVHSEISQPDKPPLLHSSSGCAAGCCARPRPGVRELHRPARSDEARVRGKVLIGDIDGVRSPALGYSPLCGADLRLDAGADVVLAVQEDFEYGVFRGRGCGSRGIDDGRSRPAALSRVDRSHVRLRSEQGGRVIMLGGQPFAEDIVMWWNFIGRSHQEIVDFRSAWERRDPRFRPLSAAREGDGGAADADDPAQATSAEEPSE